MPKEVYIASAPLGWTQFCLTIIPIFLSSTISLFENTTFRTQLLQILKFGLSPNACHKKKQKKARKSRGLEILSYIENLDVILSENHFSEIERDESLSSNLARRPESVTSNNFVNGDEDIFLNQRDINPGSNADHGRQSESGNSSAEINRLSSELNSRLSRELDEMMSSVNTQIQKAISDAISHQILPQIQTALNAGLGHVTQNR